MELDSGDNTNLSAKRSKAKRPEKTNLPQISDDTSTLNNSSTEAFKIFVESREITADLSDLNLARHNFIRVYAVKKSFSDVDFTHSDFANCHFNSCTFINCNFTGAVFKETNFTKSTFSGCRFEYSLWDKTHITHTLLDTCLPSWENVAYILACNLRVNYAQTGNVLGVNKAARIEVQQMGIMLFDMAYSKKRYYVEKRRGQSSLLPALNHAQWFILQLLWGNGESPLNVVAVSTFMVAAITCFEKFFGNPEHELYASFIQSCLLFWGLQPTTQFPELLRIVTAIVRYTLFALFTVALVRRLARR